MNKYIGHEQQLYGVREMRLVGGKADGMRILSVKNGMGLEFEISLDRCGDISRLSFKGDNMGYFAPCGYVSPKYYDNVGNGFLKSFTAGFFTTCGLTSVGTPCEDNGEVLPLHGTISNTPCENYLYSIKDNSIYITLTVLDAALFSHKLILEREYVCPLDKNEIYMTDKIKNIGAEDAPLEVLYHCNMGYPLLSEKSKVIVPSSEVVPRNEHAKEGIENCLVMEKPQKGYEEMGLCTMDEIAPIMLFMADRASVPVCVHLDHGTDMDYVKKGLDLGFTSVMYDGSELSKEENYANTAVMVEAAARYGASVEAEIGSMGARESGNGGGESIYTDPAEAESFARETGIDALACAFGTAHGLYLKQPKLDFERLAEIKSRVDIPLVMHGGSGVSHDDYR